MNKDIPILINAKALTNYKLQVKFNDGLEGVIDLSSWVGRGVFSYWNDSKNFENFKITNDKKIEWNERIDMDPDSFYLDIIGKTYEQYANNL